MLNEIFEKIINLLGDKYTVIKSFEADENIDLNGVLAINVSDVENLHHGNYKDSKYSIVINAQTFTQQDKERIKINDMFDYVQAINFDNLKNTITGCVGVVLNNSTITSDGETNNFSINIDLFICID